MPASQDPEKRATQLANLKPFPKGVSGNPTGRKPGIKNWSKIVQDLLADEEVLDKIIPEENRPEFLKAIPNKNGANAIVAVMMVAAIKGDKQAAEWLRKTGFGDKLLHEFEDGLFQTQKIEVEIVKSAHTDERDAES